MISNVRVFTFGDFKVTMLNLEGMPYFVGQDIMLSIGYKSGRSALYRHCRNRKIVKLPQDDGGNAERVVINEADLYDLLNASKMPKVQAFRDWITGEVLPTLAPKVESRDFAEGEFTAMEHHDFGRIRILVCDGKPWFYAEDISQFLVLEPMVAKMAMAKLDLSERQIVRKGSGAAEFVSEQGVYGMIPYGRGKNGKELRRFIVEEVLPNISRIEVEKRTGTYSEHDAVRRIWAARAKAQLAAMSELIKACNGSHTVETLDGIGSALLNAATEFLAHVRTMTGGNLRE